MKQTTSAGADQLMYLNEVLDFEDAAIPDCGGHSGDLNLLGVPDARSSGLHRAACPPRTINKGELNPCHWLQIQNNQCRRINPSQTVMQGVILYFVIVTLPECVSIQCFIHIHFFSLLIKKITWYHTKLCSPKLWFVPSKKDLGLVEGGVRRHGTRGVVVELCKNLNGLPYKGNGPL